MRQLHAGGPSGLLGTAASGTVWALSVTGGVARRIAQGIDSATPLATGHGRIAARMADTDEAVAKIVARLDDVHASSSRDFEVFGDKLMSDWSF